MEPTKTDLAMSMIEREVANLADFIASKFGYQGHPLVKVALEFGKKAYGNELKAFVASVVESDKTMEAGKEVLKDSVANYLDNFQTRLSKKLEEQNAQVNSETQG